MRPKPAAKKLPPPRVRFEPPTIAEAYLAAQGLTDDLEEQVVIAAGLIGQPEDDVRPHQPRPAPNSDRLRASSLMVRNRVVTVERRGPRVPLRQPMSGMR